MKKITSLEYNTLLWFLTRATFIEITAEILISTAHQDSWISILIAIIIGIIPFSLYSYLKNKYPDKNIIQINKEKLGKFGTFLNLILIAATFIFAICSYWIIVHFIDSQYLYRTPTTIIIIILILPVIYTITNNFHVFSKVSLIMFYISLIFIIIILSGLIGNVNVDNIKPILNNNPNNILYGSFCFIGFNIMPLFLLNIIPKNNIKNYSPKKSFIFYLISGLSLLNVMFLTISIFGIHLSELYNYPSFHLLKRVSVLDIIDRMVSCFICSNNDFSIFYQRSFKRNISNQRKNKQHHYDYCLFNYHYFNKHYFYNKRYRNSLFQTSINIHSLYSFFHNTFNNLFQKFKKDLTFEQLKYL